MDVAVGAGGGRAIALETPIERAAGLVVDMVIAAAGVALPDFDGGACKRLAMRD